MILHHYYRKQLFLFSDVKTFYLHVVDSCYLSFVLILQHLLVDYFSTYFAIILPSISIRSTMIGLFVGLWHGWSAATWRSRRASTCALRHGHARRIRRQRPGHWPAPGRCRRRPCACGWLLRRSRKRRCLRRGWRCR